MILYAVTHGYMDDVPVEEVRRYERQLIQRMHARHLDVVTHIRETGTLDGIEDKLKAACKDFTSSFAAAGK